MCEYLESNLLFPARLTPDQKDYYADELLGCLTWIWQWFMDARCSPLMYSQTFLSGTNALYRVGANAAQLLDLSLVCCWFYPWVQRLRGDEAEETKAALQVPGPTPPPVRPATTSARSVTGGLCLGIGGPWGWADGGGGGGARQTGHRVGVCDPPSLPPSVVPNAPRSLGVWGAGLSLRTPFFLVKDSPSGRPPRTTNCQPPTANRQPPPAIVQYLSCGIVSCPSP